MSLKAVAARTICRCARRWTQLKVHWNSGISLSLAVYYRVSQALLNHLPGPPQPPFHLGQHRDSLTTLTSSKATTANSSSSIIKSKSTCGTINSFTSSRCSTSSSNNNNMLIVFKFSRAQAEGSSIGLRSNQLRLDQVTKLPSSYQGLNLFLDIERYSPS